MMGGVMTVSAVGRNASGPLCGAAIPESVLSDFNGLRRHFRVGQSANCELHTYLICVFSTINSRPAGFHTESRQASKKKVKRPRRGHASRAVDRAWPRWSP